MNIVENKKVLALIVLAIFAVISLIYGMGGKPGARNGAPRQKAEVAKNATSSVQAPAGIQMKRRVVRTKFTSWKRSPFVPKPTSDGSYAGTKLSGILTSGKELKAMMGDMVVGKGDKIGGNTVVEVRKDSVVLNDGTKDIEIKLDQ